MNPHRYDPSPFYPEGRDKLQHELDEAASLLGATATASLDVSLGGGKYRVVQEADGHLHAFRNGEEWRELSGDKLVYCLAAEVQRLRELLEWVGPQRGYTGKEWMELIYHAE